LYFLKIVIYLNRESSTSQIIKLIANFHSAIDKII
jgi:hypothetical protein